MTGLLSKKEVTNFQLWKCQDSNGRARTHPSYQALIITVRFLYLV